MTGRSGHGVRNMKGQDRSLRRFVVDRGETVHSVVVVLVVVVVVTAPQ